MKEHLGPVTPRPCLSCYFSSLSLMFNPAEKKQMPAAARHRANTVPISHIQYNSALNITSPPAVKRLLRFVSDDLLSLIVSDDYYTAL